MSHASLGPGSFPVADYGSKVKMRFQSLFMLMTVQPFHERPAPHHQVNRLGLAGLVVVQEEPGLLGPNGRPLPSENSQH